MQIVIPLIGGILVLVLVVAIWRRAASQRSGNDANTDSELENLYSLLGDNSGRMKK